MWTKYPHLKFPIHNSLISFKHSPPRSQSPPHLSHTAHTPTGLFRLPVCWYRLFIVSIWAGILGFGLGRNFSLAPLFMVLRADSAELTTGLSGMAQSVGYFIVAFGQVLFGFLHDLTNSWSIPLYSMLTIAALQLVIGLGVAKQDNSTDS